MVAGQRAQLQCFAEAVSALAREASRLAGERRPGSFEAVVARRAAQQADEAAAQLDRLAQDGVEAGDVMTMAAWALSAAAVAVTSARMDVREVYPPEVATL